MVTRQTEKHGGSWYVLVENLALRPIRSKAVHAKAVGVLREIAVSGDMSGEVSDYFEVLSGLVEDYEKKQWPVDTADISVADILRSFMGEHNMTASDLGRMLGDRTLGHKVLTGTRKLTTKQIGMLSDHFKVSTDLFIKPDQLSRGRSHQKVAGCAV